ncbi:hypothetical protein ACF0H5_005566 [Mactra antiquata]
MCYDLFGCSFNDLVNIDTQVLTPDSTPIDWDRPTSDLLNDINNFNDTPSDDEMDYETDMTTISSAPTLAEAINLRSLLKQYALSTGNFNILNSVSQIDDELSSVLSS